MGGRGGGSGGGGGGAGERLGTVRVSGTQYPLNATVNRPSRLQVLSSNGLGQYSIDLSTPGLGDGQTFGGIQFTINEKTGTARVKYINSSQALSGQGVGNRLYARAMLEAKLQGMTTFNSDSRVSNSAVKSWQSLQSKLPAGSVTRNATQNQGPQLYAPSGSVFSVNLQNISVAQLRKMAGL